MIKYPLSANTSKILSLFMNLLQRCWYFQFVIALLALLLTACEKKNEYIAPPPAEVTVSQPIRQGVIEYLEFTGTTQSVGFVEVRARVPGILKSMHFVPGVNVEKGDLLFVIDPEPYQAELAGAQAELVSSEAKFKRAQAELKRADDLVRKNFMSKTEHLQRQTDRDVAQAAIGLKAAMVRSAEIQLSYTRVTAPISGRVGRNLVDVGNLVGEGKATLLTSVTQFKPMYAYFHLNERDLLRLMKLRREKAQQTGHDFDSRPDSELEIPLYLELADEKGYPHQGVLDFAESTLDTSTGTIELRGIFANSEESVLLVPGLFARLRLPVSKRDQALLISERALAADQSGRYVLVVNQENKVEKRPVTLGQRLDGMVVIKKGLNAEDNVIINGLQKARPGNVVNPQTASTAG
jgi:RND family efflux transporter MFP subunit